MNNELPFYSYGSYLKKKYLKPAFRVGVDAGFSCPNRGEDRNNPGCTYCDGHGARAVYLDTQTNIKKQVDRSIEFLKKRYNAEFFLLYLQAFSNTYADVKKLKEVYDYTLSLGDFKELIVSTRPDCLDEEKVQLLASYKNENFDVSVELGLQSSFDSSLEKINRGHSFNDFLKSAELLNKYNIKIIVHLIFGLPGEDLSNILETIKLIQKINIFGIKIHNLHVPYGTLMYDDYEKGLFKILEPEEHLEYVISALEHISKDIVMLRFTCDTPKDRRAAPKDFWKKTYFYSILKNEMFKRETFQGRLFNI